jgi:hypothetical protein
MRVQPFLLGTDPWTEIRDGNASARALFDRHYSRRIYRDGRQPAKFIGPGQYMALMTPEADAILVWRKFISKDEQQGINCAIFRNESPRLSSELLKDGMLLAWARWPGERLYTYVNAARVRSTNPGYCFLRAGWRKCGTTKKRRLIILECVA